MDCYHPLYFLGMLPGKPSFSVLVLMLGSEKAGDKCTDSFFLCLFPDPLVWYYVFRFCRSFLLDKSDSSL